MGSSSQEPACSRAYRRSHTTWGLTPHAIPGDCGLSVPAHLDPSLEKTDFRLKPWTGRLPAWLSHMKQWAPRGEGIAAFVVLKEGRGPYDELRQATIEDERSVEEAQQAWQRKRTDLARVSD